LRAGTRLNVRGIDDDGNVSNFVEQEQIVKINTMNYAFVSTRGSVPIFWSQGNNKNEGNLYEDVQITRSTEMTREAFQKHFQSMTDDYQFVQIIDLLKDKREREKKLTREYYRLFRESEFKQEGQLDFLHFDFASFVKGDKFQALRILLQQTRK